MRLPARIYGFFLAFFLIIFIPKVSFAQISTEAQQYQTPNVNSNVPKNMHFWTQNVMLEVMSSMICQLAGIDPINPNQQCLGVDRQTGKIGFVKNGGGAIGVTGSLIAGTFLIPVHFSDYATYAVNNFGFPEKSYAQRTGIGYTGLQPVLGLFTIFRNISYLLMVFVFIIIGVAIMLRLRIDPRTVMTIQNQIPKLVIGLVMITFSYAIVGLLIDVMWVSTYFVINTITPVQNKTAITEAITLPAPYFINNLFNNGGIVGLSAGGANQVGDLINNAMTDPKVQESLRDNNDQCRPFDFGCGIGNIMSGAIGGLLNLIVGWIISFFARIIVFFILLIAMLVALFKLFFALIKCFVTILLDTILAPFWILGGLLPGAGQSIGIGPWLRDVAANLAVFPAVIFLFLIARTIMEGFGKTTIYSDSSLMFNPPLIGNATDQTGNFGALIAVGFILAAPGVVESVKKAFKASSGVGLGGAAVGAAAVGAVGGAIGHRLYGKDYQGIRRGPLINVGQRATRAVAESPVGRRIERVTSPIRNSRFAGWFRPPQSDNATASQPTQPSSTPQSTGERPAPRAKVIRGPRGDTGPKGDTGAPESPPPTQQS